jgi:hypothetical protein
MAESCVHSPNLLDSKRARERNTFACVRLLEPCMYLSTTFLGATHRLGLVCWPLLPLPSGEQTSPYIYLPMPNRGKHLPLPKRGK